MKNKITMDKSKLWKQYFSLLKIPKIKIKNFKKEDVNYKIGPTNPKRLGFFYYKMLLMNIAQNLSKKELGLLKRIKKRNVGNPTTVKVNNVEIDFDYFQSLKEFLFLKEKIKKKIFNIIEIGAGYGRTCHAFLSLNNDLKKYLIIDFPEMLSLSSKYLKKVLDNKNFKKVSFIDANQNLDNITELNLKNCLTININSFNEMSDNAFNIYIELINGIGGFFYTKNPVAKFNDPEITTNIKRKRIALNTGQIKKIINIFNEKELNKAKRNYVQTYLPSTKWKIISTKFSRPLIYYLQTLYEKKNN